jgi:hypothetical protein
MSLWFEPRQLATFSNSVAQFLNSKRVTRPYLLSPAGLLLSQHVPNRLGHGANCLIGADISGYRLRSVCLCDNSGVFPKLTDDLSFH